MGTVFTNGQVALTMCPIFGLAVYGESADEVVEWMPWTELDRADRDLVRELLDHNPTCPASWAETVYQRERST